MRHWGNVLFYHHFLHQWLLIISFPVALTTFSRFSKWTHAWKVLLSWVRCLSKQSADVGWRQQLVLYLSLQMLSRDNTGLGRVENGGFTLKKHQMFFVHAITKEFKTKQSSVILDLCLTKTRPGKSRDYRGARLLFLEIFRPHESLRTVGPTVEINLRSYISPVWCRRGLRLY